MSNGTVSGFTTTSASVYEAQITPTTAGTVTVDVAADAAQDEAGNANTAATQATSTYTAPVTNTAPAFPRDATPRAVAENTATGTDFDAPVAARDEDNDPLAYELTAGDVDAFAIDPATGQLRTVAALNHEEKDTYTVTVTATDDEDASASTEVTITVTDVDEQAGTPNAPTVEEKTSVTKLGVRWDEPDTAGGPAISSYEIRVAVKDSDTWSVVTTSDATTSAELSDLQRDTEYEVQVRANNGEIASEWSPSGEGTTRDNNRPRHHIDDRPDAIRLVSENAAVGTNVGNRFQVIDPDGDPITHWIQGESARELFAIDETTGQITTKVKLDYEEQTSIRIGLAVTDRYGQAEDWDPESQSVDASITGTTRLDIYIQDEAEPPLAPEAPTVTGDSSTSLLVTWTAPDNTGRPDIEGYALQYRKQGEPGWTPGPSTVTHTQTTIANLEPGTPYEVSVRASNDEGTSDWSTSGEGATLATDATLSELTVSDGASALTLAPAFTSGTFVYTTEVASTVSQVTLTAVTTDDGASVSAVTLDGNAIADDDFSDGITVPSLVVGNNAIVVTVTAEDSVSTRTYMVTVTRTAANDPATGAPTITGTAQVGQTLTAGRGNIADPDGLPATFPDDYSFEWVRVDTSNTETAIAGATSGTYVPVVADVDSTIKVRVSFTDAAGNDEGPLESEAVGPVVAAALPELSFAAPLVDVNETAGSVAVTVTLAPASTGTVTVDYRMIDSGTNAGEDYTAQGDTLTFAPGETSKTITIPITDDNIHESIEYFVVYLADPTGATLSGTAADTQIRITSDDPEPTASMADVTVDEGAGTMRLTLRLDRPSSELIRYSAVSGDVGGTATVSEDYADFLGSPDFGVISVPAGELTGEFDITILDDNVAESAETITIGWSKVSNSPATPNVLRVTGTITDNDGTAATGQPTITGTPQVGETLTAGTSGIMDDDGLPSSFDYQWVRVDTSNIETVIAGATSGTYTPVAADVGATIKVAVSFTDNAGHAEGPLVSAAVGPVEDTPPTVTSIERQNPTTSPTNADSLTWRVTFNEAVANVGAADFTVSGTTATLTVAAVSGSSSRYDVTASGGNLANRTATVTLAFASNQNITDTAGTALADTTPTGTNENTYELDNTAPTVEITDVPATSSAAFTATFTFSEAVTGFAPGDVEVGNGIASEFMEPTAGTVFTALITPTTDGEVTVDVAADAARDAAGNANTAATQARSTYTAPDEAAPKVVSIERQNPTTSPTNADSLTWRVMFDEAVANVDAADFTVTGTTAPLTVTAVSGATARYDVTASGGNLANRTATVTLAFASDQDITDTAGNALTAATPTGTNENTYVVDNTAPTVVITDVPATSSAPFTATFTFSEAVTGFTLSDVEVSNGAASGFTTTTTSVYTAQITPTTDGEVTVDVAADAARDAAGNANTAATQARSTYTAPDEAAPKVVSIERQNPTTSPTNADSLTWRVMFDEAVANVGAADFTVTGTTAPLTVTAVSGATARYDVTASGGNLANRTATVTLAFASDQDITDTAGTALADTTPTGTNENTYELDNTAPTVVITDVPATSSAAFTATFTFSEAVTGFALGDVEVGNGIASEFMEPTAGTVFTALITPTTDGEVTVDVAADAARDAAGNANTAATQARSTYTAPDEAAPKVVSIERQNPTTSPTNADSLTWRVMFDEAVANVDAADFTVTGTTAPLTVTAVSGATARYDVTASGGTLADLDGTVTLGFASDQDITDTAGNALTAATPTGTNENTYVVDNTAPTVAITDVPATSSAAFTATFTFSEAVTGFALGDVEVGNGTASGFTTTSASVYTAQITPITDGEVTVDVAADAAQDAAGNANTAAAQARSEYTAPDTTAPRVRSITRQNPTTSPTNADSLTWRVTFNEAVANVGAADFAVDGTTATVTVTAVSGATARYDVTASGGDLADRTGTVTLAFASNQDITDTAGTALADTTPTGTNENTYELDNTAPTVTITGVPATSSAPFTATFIFSEAVTGFALGDVEVGNGTASAFTATSERVYTALITPAAGGQTTVDVTVEVAADAATDAAGNANTAAAQARSTYTVPDEAAPKVLSIERQNPATGPTNADSLTWRVTFSEAVANVDAGDFALSGTTATVTAVTEVAGVDHAWDVTAGGGSLASMTGTVTLSFASDQDIEDADGTALANTTPTGTNENRYKVDNTAPVVTRARIASGAGVDGVSRAEDKLKAMVRFSKAVTVDTTGGEPTLTVMLGDGRREVAYYGGSGTRALRFHHEMEAADDGGRGAWVMADGLSANGATIRSAAGVEAVLGVTPPPVVTSVSVAADTDGDGLWSAGEAVIVTVDFSDAVTVRTANGTPSVSLMAGRPREAVYSGGSGTASLRFAYTMTGADKTAGAVTVSSNALTLNGGAIMGPTGLAAVLSHAMVYRYGTPTRTSSSLSVSDASASEGGTLAFTVTLDPAESVTVWVDWATSDGTAQAGEDYEAGSGKLIFYPGMTSQTVRLAVLADEEVEGAETMRLTLSNAAGARLPDAAASGTVSDPDPSAEAPPVISIADAMVDEEPGAVLEFAVTLDRASASRATVDWETRDGNARAGKDYVGGSGTLVFAPGETAKTIRVAVLDDAHDEGREVMLVMLWNPVGATIAKSAAGGIIENSDLMPQAWLARFGRTVAEQVIEAVEERIRSAPRAGVEVTVAGQAIGPAQAPGTEALEEAEAKARLEGFSAWLRGEACRDGSGAGGDCPARMQAREVAPRELLTGSSFALTAQADGIGGGLVSLWGRGALTRFDGREGELSLSGEVTGALLGADWTRERSTLGLMLGHARGEGGYRGADSPGSGSGASGGEVASTVTGLYPYGRYMLSDRVTVWGAAGYGAGTLTLTPEPGPDADPGDGESYGTDMDLMMAAAGLRGVVVEAPAGGGPELAVKTDAMGVRTSSEAVRGGGGGNLAAATADVTRLRLGLEGTWRGLAIGTGTLEPRLEIGVRHDGGDAETGFGLDLGPGLAWSDPGTGIRAEASGRGLLSHESAGFRERGIAGSFGWDLAPGSDRGPSVTLTQTLGVSASGGADALLGRATLEGLAANDDGDELARRRLEVKLGYGFGAFGDRFTSRPEAGFAMSPGHRDYGLVWRLVRDRHGGDLGSLEFSLEVRRRERANDPGPGAEPEHGVGFRMTARW